MLLIITPGVWKSEHFLQEIGKQGASRGT